jgi:hypothetical protein
MTVAERDASRWIGLAVAAGLLIGVPATGASEIDRLRSRVVEVHRSFPGVRLLALRDDQLLLWEVHGRTQLRRSDGTWTADFQLPVERILDVEVDGSGYLLAGVLPQDGPVVMSMAASGEQMTRWKIAGDGAYAVVSDPSGRWAVTRSGTVPLLPDGTTGEVDPYPEGHRFGHGKLPTVLKHNGATVICYASDHARGSCERLGRSGWRFEGDFIEPPFSCGAWIITKNRSPSGSGTRVTELAAWSLATGTVAAHTRHRVPPVTACAEPDVLVVGERRIRLVRLPNLESTWSGPVDAGSPVQDVAVTKSLFAYRPYESLDISLLPRPSPPPRDTHSRAPARR